MPICASRSVLEIVWHVHLCFKSWYLLYPLVSSSKGYSSLLLMETNSHKGFLWPICPNPNITSPKKSADIYIYIIYIPKRKPLRTGISERLNSIMEPFPSAGLVNVPFWFLFWGVKPHLKSICWKLLSSYLTKLWKILFNRKTMINHRSIIEVNGLFWLP